MKLVFVSIALLGSFYLSSQEKTFTLKELDSITATKEIVRDSTYDEVPIYKGCEKWMTFAGKKKCFNDEIGDFFSEHFNRTIPKNSKIASGKIEIFITFTVNKEGNIVDGKAEAPNDYFEKEALRVLKLLSKLTPGYIKGKPINMPFSIPIIVTVEHEKDKLVDKTYPIYRGCDKDLSFEETKKCTKERIIDYIKVSFNYELADKAFPTAKKTQFQVEFIINEKGKTEDVNVKAHHKVIAIDVIQLIKRMPKFKNVGTTNGQPVKTPFSVLMTVYF